MIKTILSDTVFGGLSAIGAALAFAIWNLYLQRGLEKGGGPQLTSLTLSVSLVVTCLPLTLWLWWQGALPPLPLSGVGWMFVAGLLTAGVGPFHSTHATRRIGAVRTTSLRLLDPFFAFAIAYLFLHEGLTAGAIAGVVLIVAALALLQLDRKEAAARTASPRGVAFAVAASLYFTVGSVLRKLGLTAIPSAIVASLIEGLSGLVVVLLTLAVSRDLSGLREALRPDRRDFWRSGLAAAAGSFLIALALQRIPVPIAVALRNTSPWFALVLVPVLIGAQHRPGRWVWMSTALLTVGMLLIVLR